MDSDQPNPIDTEDKFPKSPRKDLVRSYGSAIVTIGEKTYKKISEQNGAIAWIARKLNFIILAIIWWIKFTWLSHLSFIDKQIQTVEWILTLIFPSSQPLFLTMYNLGNFADSMPDKFENVINALGEFIGQFPYFPLFDWGVELLEEIFSIMLSLLPGFGSTRYDNLGENEMNYENDMIVREAIKEKIREVDNDLNNLENKKGDKMHVNKDVLELFDNAWHLKN